MKSWFTHYRARRLEWSLSMAGGDRRGADRCMGVDVNRNDDRKA